MAQFVYKARSAAGQVETGVAEATDKEELIHQLREKQLFCFQVREQREKDQGTSKPLKLKHLSTFCRQLAALLHAGVSMAQALDTLYKSSPNRQAKEAALTLYEGVLKGQSLSATMQQMGKTFPELLTYMTETGEASGTLDIIMEKMALHYEQELQMKKKIQSALIYPVLLSIISLGSVIFLLTTVLPQFVDMYQGMDLPAPTRLLLGINQFVTNNWLLLLGILLAFVLLSGYLMTQKRFRISVKWLIFRLPLVGRLVQTILTSRFASTFSVLYASGISILKSLDITSRVLGNDYVEQRMLMVAERLRLGGMLSESLAETGVFNQMFISMVLVGEESGTLDDMLQKTGDFFEKEANTALTQMIALIEPLMIVIFGMIISFIVLAIILPIFNMYGQLQ